MTDQNTEETTEQTETTEEGRTFPAEYVRQLRDEAAGHRTRAKEAEESLAPLQQRLFTMLVEKTGRLADPSDLPFDAALIDDEGALDEAIESLLAAKPHLASRRVVGDVGQGAGKPRDGEVSLASILAAGA